MCLCDQFLFPVILKMRTELFAMVRSPPEVPQLAACLSQSISFVLLCVSPTPLPSYNPCLFLCLVFPFSDLCTGHSSGFRCLLKCYLLREDFPFFHTPLNPYPFPLLSEIFMCLFIYLHTSSLPL